MVRPHNSFAITRVPRSAPQRALDWPIDLVLAIGPALATDLASATGPASEIALDLASVTAGISETVRWR